jgi:ribonuclease VapC
MIVDTSALIAILKKEPDADRFIGKLATVGQARMSAATFVESAIVVDANGDPVLSRRLNEVIDSAGIAIEPLTAEQAQIARRAYQDFGKGSGHPAGLNLGDCFSYALAAATGQPLLYKGNDFTHTDLTAA